MPGDAWKVLVDAGGSASFDRMRATGWRKLDALWIACALLLSGCVTSREAALERFEFEQPQMGVPFRIVLFAPDEARARTAAAAAFARVARLNGIMSDYETESEISRLSRSSEEGSPEVPVSEDLWTVLSAAQQLAAESGGAFDVTAGPCVALWRKARREQQFPDLERLENARRKVGFQNLVLDPKTRSARLLRRGMRLDLGGIAKGYAADEALETLRELGYSRALVAASGDLALGDPPPGEQGWRVEIAGYDRPDGPPAAIIRLANRGVATSGDLFQRAEIDGVRYSHIVSPFTCVGMTNHALATVIARDCMTADSLATAATLVDPPSALALAARRRAAVRVVRMEEAGPRALSNTRFQKVAGAGAANGRKEAPAAQGSRGL